MKVLWAGLIARRGLNAAALLVTVTALASSLLGPMYGRASAEHLLDTRLQARAPYTVGLSDVVAALDPENLPQGGPDAYDAPDPAALTRRAAATLDTPEVDRFWQRPRSWLLDRGGTLEWGGRVFTAPLYWREDMCRLATVTGRCPQAAGEALLDETLAHTLGATPGDTIRLTSTETWQAGSADGEVVRTRPVVRAFTMTGTYRIEHPQSPDWFDLSRFEGDGRLTGSAASTKGSSTPTAPALLVGQPSMTGQGVLAGVDRPIDTATVDLDTMRTAQATADRVRGEIVTSANSDLLDLFELRSLFDDVETERGLLSHVTLAALAPLVVLALLLLHALVSAAAESRRPYVALAKLRGHSPRQVLRFALSEPFLVVALALPVSVALAWGAARLIADAWLSAQVPVVPDRTAWLSLAAVTVAALASAAAAAVAVMREPLSAALASSVRPRPSGRMALILRSGVVALAVGSVAQLVASRGSSSGQLLGLLAPLFIALATAVAGVGLLHAVTRWWVGRTRGRSGTSTYLASRRLTRRQDLTKLMVPLLLAVSVITFATSASATADDWRVSRAFAEVGAARTYQAGVTPSRLLAVTREVDPEGKYLAAAVLPTDRAEGMNRRVFVDTTRLARVASWDEAWSDRSVRRLQDELAPPAAEPLRLTGHHISVALKDVRLTSAQKDVPWLWVEYTDLQGGVHDLPVGALDGRDPALSDSVLSADLTGCERACTLDQVYLSGSSASVTDIQGSLTLTGVWVDGEKVDWKLTEEGAWRAARPFPVTPVDPPVVLTPAADGLHLDVYLGQLPAGEDGEPAMVAGFARITPATVPEVAPVLVASGTPYTALPAALGGTGLTYPAGTALGAGLNGTPAPVRVVGEVTALPGLGKEGELGDLETTLREYGPTPDMLLDVQLWVADGTPASVLEAVRHAGVPLSGERVRAATLHDLRSDAFSLGWRIFLLVGAVTLLLAIFGVLASAVAQARWRSYEVAALRVVGVRQRDLVRASVWEYAVMLGFAVALGLVSAWLALVLVLPSVDLGGAADTDPAASYAVHWRILAGVGMALFALSLLIAIGVSKRVTRLGRPSILRWAESR